MPLSASEKTKKCRRPQRATLDGVIGGEWPGACRHPLLVCLHSAALNASESMTESLSRHMSPRAETC